MSTQTSGLALLWPSAQPSFPPPPLPTAQVIFSVCSDFFMGPLIGHGLALETE